MAVTVTAAFLLSSVFLFPFSRAEHSRANLTSKPCDVLYTDGVNSYLEERWADCILNLESGIQCYRGLKQSIVQCRLKCGHEAEESVSKIPASVQDLHFYEKLIKNTLCLQKCRKLKSKKPLPSAIPRETEIIYEELKPYEYLHMCYFQKYLIQKAASAVFTYLVRNSEDEIMRNNLKYYFGLPEVDPKTIVNFEAQEYTSLYIRGADAYEKEDYHSVIQYIEMSLEGYLQSEEECRVYCEGSFDQGWFPDFVSSVANHFTYTLKCKSKCSAKLNSLNGEVHDDLLPSHYHFLQYAYYKTGKILEACRAVSSFLLFYPEDETMLDNKKYYSKLPEVKPKYFTPREEAVKYLQRQKYETELLDFIEKEFTFSNEVED